MPSPSSEHPLTTPNVPDGPAWDEAFLRVESYLHAHHLESRVLLNQLATEIIHEARERMTAHPDESAVCSAMRVTHDRIGAWFARAGNAGDWADERVRARGRLALLLADIPARRRGSFLSPDAVSPDLAGELARGVLRPGPELRFSNMPAAPLQFGFADPDGGDTPKRNKWTTLRAAAGWLLITGMFGVAWAASH